MTDYFKELFSLEGKTILVTGGAKGLGAMMTESLLRGGARVIIASRSKEDCEQASKRFSEFGECIAMPHNLASEQAVEALAVEVGSLTDELFALINNSGVTWGAPLETFPAEAFDRVLNLNVKTPFMLVQKLLPQLKQAATEANPARVVNIGSVAGFAAGTMNAYSYQASKAAIHHLTKGLAKDLASDDINVNAIAPGLFESRMTAHIQSNEQLLDSVVSHVPRRRMGYPHEIGALALYLCSPASAYMTGNVIPLDGGTLLSGG